MPKSIAEQSAELRIAVSRLSRRLRAQKADDAMTDGQFSVLWALGRHGTQTLTSLAEHEHVSAPSMNRTVDALEAGGYLVRTADETDRRKTNLDLTDAGREFVRATLKRRDAWLTERLRALPKSDRELVADAVDILRRITAE